MAAAFRIDRVHYYHGSEPSDPCGTPEKGHGRYQEMLQKRAERIPLQQILGMQDFMGMTFSVDENVLIPRQDTETLVERVLRDYPEKDLKLLDMCTGSGCIAISLAVLGGYQNVTAADISEAELRVAKKNARRLFLIQKGTARSESFQVSEDPVVHPPENVAGRRDRACRQRSRTAA
ncbi:MAG: 50S ribosomal protein L11 methyltransferase [Clostridium fessum]